MNTSCRRSHLPPQLRSHFCDYFIRAKFNASYNVAKDIVSFLVLGNQEDHELRDAVCRGGAGGLAHVFSVPEHPPGNRELLAAAIANEGDGITADPDPST